MRITHVTAVALGISLLTACHADNRKSRKPPTQVVYRFDDHRYLELVGFNCEGALWFTDTRRNIHSEVTSQFYHIFTKLYRHPSERYMAVTMYEGTGFFVSKDYGKTWYLARYTPGGGAKRYGDRKPSSDDILSFIVVNDQGFIQTKSGDLYMSSKPFDDPRLQPGGEGIPYSYRNSRGELKHDRLMPGFSGMDWGREYTSWNSVLGPDHWSTSTYKPNWQGIPNKVPEVKNYTGWDHMRCDPDLGLPASGRGK
ncbi:T6SS immunity protein Tli3 family protein [Citrobacter werkmanii]